MYAAGPLLLFGTGFVSVGTARGLGREIKTAKTGEAINRAFYVGFVDQYFGHRAPSADRCR